LLTLGQAHTPTYTRSKRFDLILAADVVCHEDSFQPLLATLRQLAGAPCNATRRLVPLLASWHFLILRRARAAGGGEVLLCNKCRDVAEHAFWHAAAEDFHVEVLQEGLPAEPRDGDELPVLLYRMWLKQPAAAAQAQHANGGS
jgi:hypothetical protein